MPAPAESGLTLVELLVVLAIVGIMAGATVLGMGGGNRATGAENEARRLAVRLRLAADETMVTDRVLAFAPDAHGYRFVTWDGVRHRWQPDSVAELGDRHDLAADMTLAVAGTTPLVVGADGAGGAIRARLSGRGSAWTVAFDGGTALATPAP